MERVSTGVSPFFLREKPDTEVLPVRMRLVPRLNLAPPLAELVAGYFLPAHFLLVDTPA